MDTQVLIIGAFGPSRSHIGDRPRDARHPLHGRRAEARAAIPAQDGALQRAHHGNLPADGPAGGDSRAAACRPAHCPMDVFSALSCVEPPLTHDALSLVPPRREATIAKLTDATPAGALSACFRNTTPRAGC